MGEPDVGEDPAGVADDPGGDDHPRLRVRGRETGDLAGDLLAAAPVEDLVQPVEDHHGPATRAEVPQQAGEGVGLHGRLALAGEAHVGRTAVGPVPEDDLVAPLGQRLGQLAHAGGVLGEPAARRDRPRSSLTDHLVGDPHAVDHNSCHDRHRTLTYLLATTPLLNGTRSLYDGLTDR